MGRVGNADSAGPVRDPERDAAGKPTAPREPDLTKDELDVGWGERPHEPGRLSEDDERLLRERPPHWE